MDDIRAKQKMIKEIQTCLEEIDYIRRNLIFDSELSFDNVKKIDLLVGNLWLKYHKLILP